jgi:transposase
MRTNYREMARLKRKEVSNRRIAEIMGISRNTVNRIIRIMVEKQLGWGEIEGLSDHELNSIFDTTGTVNQPPYVIPDYAKLSKELARPGVTMQLLWEEYQDQCRLSKTMGYQVTQFKKYFNEYLIQNQFTEVIRHKAGERIEVDWAGTRVRWMDPDTGEVQLGYLFVGVLSFSGYAFAMACADMTQNSWSDAHNQMFQHFGGVSQLLIPDNLKTGVTSHGKETIVLNQTYSELAEHYGMIVLPARVRRPKDKPQVENAVGKLTTHIIARMRDFQFFSIVEYNNQLRIELDRFNHKPFQKKEGSRSSIFESLEKPHLKPLPKSPYEIAQWRKAKVQANSHISVQKCYYSVPYQSIGKEVTLRISAQTLDIYDENTHLCTHRLIKSKIGVYSTDSTHLPEQSAQFGEWNSSRYLNWAKKKGPYTEQLIQNLFNSAHYEQKVYRSVHSILKLADLYSDQRLESACQLALENISKPSYKHLKAILLNNQDQSYKHIKPSVSKGAFIRGGEYYGK